jgi:hypothetical protein
MVGAFTQWLRNGGYKRFYGQNEFGLQPTGQHPGYRYGMGNMFGVYYDELSRLPPISDFGFYGNPLMPIAAIYYWVAGGGVPRSIDIRSLNLRMGLGDFKPIKDVLSNSNYSVGTYQVSSFFSTNLFTHAPTDLWAAGTLGRIGGDINGVLTINADNTYVFNGSYTLHPDKFDANRDRRPFVQERLTDFLRSIGNLLGSKDYTINFSGAEQVTLSGHRNDARE